MIRRPMARPRVPCLALVVLALALGAAGCGEPAAVDAGGPRLVVRLDEFRIAPQNVRVRLDGRPLRIVARNDGRLTHNLKVESLTRTNESGTPLVLGGTATVAPGGTERATIRLRPGRYRLACTLGNHDNLGQYGELIVSG